MGVVRRVWGQIELSYKRNLFFTFSDAPGISLDRKFPWYCLGHPISAASIHQNIQMVKKISKLNSICLSQNCWGGRNAPQWEKFYQFFMPLKIIDHKKHWINISHNYLSGPNPSLCKCGIWDLPAFKDQWESCGQRWRTWTPKSPSCTLLPCHSVSYRQSCFYLQYFIDNIHVQQWPIEENFLP